MMMTNPHFFEYAGAFTGIAGAIVMALNLRWSSMAFVIWVLSNVFMIGYAIQIHADGMLAMQVVFLVINLISIWRWLLQPKLLFVTPPKAICNMDVPRALIK